MQLNPNTLLQGGKYRIERVLGQGGFGITYQATQDILNRKVAIKEFFFKDYCERDGETSRVSLGTQNTREVVERFMDKFIKEARTISQLDHPNIIRIHDVFRENNTAYYVMDYIEGDSLSHMVAEQGALPEEVALGYIRQVASALAFIHDRNINHLDVKPANIMVRKSDGRAILIDFGLSKQYDAQGGQTSSTPVGISHGYAPMEQYNAGGVSMFSPQADIYSLGATLYKLVTGITPPQANEVFNEGLPPMPQHLSSTTIAAIEKAMQPGKKQRPQSVAEFMALLTGEEDETIIPIESDPEPVPDPHPDPVSSPSSWKKWALPLAAGVIAALAVILWPKGGQDEKREDKVEAVVQQAVAQQQEPVKPVQEQQPVKTESEKPAVVKEEIPAPSLLYVTTSPSGATVYVDGKKVGTSPITKQEVVAGRHTVKITLDGYESFSKKLSFGTDPVILNETLKEKAQSVAARPFVSTSSTSGGKEAFTVNGVSFTMVRVGGGTFQMGSSDGESDEKPVHSVTLSGYWIGETEVTQALWQAVMGGNPSHFKGDNRPVEMVSWNDCRTFISKLNSLTGRNFRLPTEAEWEFAARGGNSSRGYKYSGSDNLGSVGWYADNSGSETHPVKSKSPNELGIYDMSGNVWEWCSDWYASSYYGSSPSTNPTGPSAGSYRVFRGGGWDNGAAYCRVAYRYRTPWYSPYDLGLRLAL